MMSNSINSEDVTVHKIIDVVDAEETVREPTNIMSPALSFTEAAIRVATPYLPQWITTPILPSTPSTQSSKITTNVQSPSDCRQQSTSNGKDKNCDEQKDHPAIELQLIGLKPPPKGTGRDRRRVAVVMQDQDENDLSHSPEDTTIFSSEYTRPPSSPVAAAPSQFESYWRPLSSSFTPESVHYDKETLYEGSIRTTHGRHSRSRSSYAASLLSTRARMDMIEEEEGDENPTRSTYDHYSPQSAYSSGGFLKLSLPSLGGLWTGHGHDHSHGYHSHHHRHHHSGKEIMDRFTSLLATTGQAALDYLNDSVVPTTVDLAQRGVNSTLSAISAGLQLPGVIIQNSTQIFFSHHELPGPQQEQQHASSRTCGAYSRNISYSRSSSTPGLVRQNIKNVSDATVKTPDSAHLRDRPRRRSTDPNLPIQSSSVSNQGTRSRHQRRYPLQTIPGPEGLDPRIRRELEAQGFAALGLRDGTEGSDWRSRWDPRRYGLRKYIICNEIRTPRPCTVILLAILIACIVFPIAFRR
ncbi:hypothetical protein BGZ83_009058 [Gryganskiella cystojenkinii]|nr:hypothetical protein BGZ83_009058 [Gryganskiella cystojenkinii]